MLFKASAPGSLMLLGEYAVLDGGYALVAAINQRMTVQLATRSDTKINISSQLGKFVTDVTQLQVAEPFQFVLTALKKFKSQLPTGCDIEIESEFSDRIGFASSAAVTVALLKVLCEWIKLPFGENDLIQQAREIVRDVQGMGSGADVAACVLGGVVAYRAEPFYAERIEYDSPIIVKYSGSKTKTADAIKFVRHRFESRLDSLKNIYQEIATYAQQGIQAARENNHAELGKIMNLQQRCMENLGVTTPALDEIINSFKNDSRILGAKISGAGLGDCVIGLGEIPDAPHVMIASRGVVCE